MKKISLFLVLFAVLALKSFGQTAFNPFTQNIHFEPEPSPSGFECGSTQLVAFTAGLTTADDATLWQTNPLVIQVCIAGFTFNGPAATIVTGTYASNFNWSFDPAFPNCIFGTQNQTLVGTGSNPIFPNPLASGSIKIALKVPETSPIGTVLSVSASLQVPAYMSAFNSLPDDNESTQTQTYCPLRITGTIFNDTDSSNTNVNGAPIQAPDATPLYAILVNSSNNTVVASVPVSSNGTYTFLNVPGNTTYKVVLTTGPEQVGAPAPVPDLPVLWVNSGEDCCDQTGDDGNPDGVLEVVLTNFSRYNADFGIRKPTPTGTPLQTVLTSFFVSEYNCAGLLSWTTSREENTSHVDVYRRDAQGLPRKIATVQSTGVSQTEKVYSYLDKGVNTGVQYEYQLKFVDIDGHFTTSDIKTLRLDCSKASSTVNIFPNPVVNELNVLYVTEKEDMKLDVAVVDLAGRTLMEARKDMVNGGSVLTLDVKHLAAGTYILHYQDSDGSTTGSIKFVIH